MSLLETIREFVPEIFRADEEVSALMALETAVRELIDGGYIEPGPRSRALRSHLAAIDESRSAG